jgi:hypothetical protein
VEKQVVVFDSSEEKKHSVCFKTSQERPGVTSIYIMKSCLGQPYPKKVKVTIEEVKE